MRVSVHVRLSVAALWCAMCAGATWLGAAEPVRETWTIDGVEREALIYPPTERSEGAVPLVFAFHGHGGSARNVARAFRVQTHWPQALVVYMQGLPTPGRLTDPNGERAGWQNAPGDQGDRDLKFFDQVLEHVKQKYAVDPQRIYSIGHSNGGGFTYLLWATRGDVLAAIAPSGAAAGRRLTDFKPKPVLHIAGEKDQLVKFSWQQLSIERVKQINQCQADGEREGKCLTRYPSAVDAPVWTYIYPGGHRLPADEVMPVIVKFLQQYRLTRTAQSEGATQ